MFKIYGHSSCVACGTAKTFLERSGFAHEYIDVMEDLSALEVLKKHNVRTLPLILRDEEYIGGLLSLTKYFKEIIDG
tara:strand:+ start:1157 stop:1387 length:231 start_codon:yes stop_codon:yes gene_type:complete